jgi:hypothetical protein
MGELATIATVHDIYKVLNAEKLTILLSYKVSSAAQQRSIKIVAGQLS